MKNQQIIVVSVVAVIIAFFLGHFFGDRNQTASPLDVQESEVVITDSNSLNTEGDTTLGQNNPDEYASYVSYVESICPFVTSVSTRDCMDAQIEIQRTQYNDLATKILVSAKKLSDELTAKDEPVDMETSGILRSIPGYMKIREDYIEKLCSLRTFSTTGTAIGEEMRTCFMYYNSKDIEQLERISAAGYR